MNQARFFTYQHRYADTGEVFYIGKGVGNRATACSKRSTEWKLAVLRRGRNVEILAFFWAEQDALNHERELIAEGRAAGLHLLNKTSGGQGASGLVHSDDAKQKMAAAARGRPVSLEVRRKLSEVHKGRIMTPEHRQRLSEANFKRFATPEGRQQAIECQKGRIFSEEHRSRISASKKGVALGPIAQDVRARMAEAQRKRFESPAEREKIRQARLAAGRRMPEVVHV